MTYFILVLFRVCFYLCIKNRTYPLDGIRSYIFAELKQWPNVVGNVVLIYSFLYFQASSLSTTHIEKFQRIFRKHCSTLFWAKFEPDLQQYLFWWVYTSYLKQVIFLYAHFVFTDLRYMWHRSQCRGVMLCSLTLCTRPSPRT